MRTLLAWLFGFVTARMVGSEPEALLNQCAQQGLTLWKMERLDPVTLLVKVPAIQWRRVEALAERMGCQAEDVQRRGVPCFLGRFRRRYGLLVGLVLCLLLFGVGSRTILTFDVTGNETVSAQEILGQLRLCGVSVGTYGPKIPIRTVENQMMQALHQLSFFSINVHGTRAEIIVRERDAIPDLRPENIPGNVVAAASGEITHIEPWAGDALVQEGDGVAAGDVLISGAMEMDTSNPLELERPKRLVHAEGKVLASTRRTLTACLDLTAQGKRYTGEETTRYALSILGKRVKFFRNSGISYANYDTMTKLKSWTPPLGDCLPIVWEAETFRAYDPVEQPLDAAAAEALLQAQLRKALEEALGQGEILTTRCETTQEGDRLFVTLTAHCFEDIAKEVPMTADEIAQIRAAPEPPPTEEKPAKE